MEGFYGISCDNIRDGDPDVGSKNVDGIDIYGVNLRFGVESPSLFGVDWITPEIFAIVGYSFVF